MILFLRKIWDLTKLYRFRLFLGVITGIIAGALEPLMVGAIIFVYGVVFPAVREVSKNDDIAPRLPHFALKWYESLQDWLELVRQTLTSGVKDHPGRVIALVSLIPLVVFLRGLFSYLNVYFLQWVGVRAITDLRIRLFQHLMNLSAGFFTQSKSGDLISRMNNDTGFLQIVITNATSIIVKDPTTLVCTLVWLMCMNWRLTLISLVVLPLCLIPISIFGRKVRNTARRLQDKFSDLTGVMSESFTANRIIKAYNLEGTVVEQFRETARKLTGYSMRIVRAMEAPGPLMEFFAAVAVAALIYYQADRANGDPKAFLNLLLALFIMYQPVKRLGRLANLLEQAKASNERVFELLEMRSTIPEPATPKPLNAAGAEILFDDIYFNYEAKEVLHGVQLTAKPGQMLALVGASGSGKTTLTNLLLRFYDPAKGSVRIGGTDIREVSTLDLRGQIGIVTQETLLFNETIRRNIELGRPGATEAEIIAAAKHAHAHEFIMEKEGGYDAVIGEKGAMLSGGQKQRLAIARAILKKAPILILDEATSALDTQSERAVQAALEELMRGRTCICIAHRLSTIHRADVIAVLDRGRVVEMGRHEELLRLNGFYRRLYELDSRPPPGAE
jgi:subfamily B ATP-binding cassette protein MsbA